MPPVKITSTKNPYVKKLLELREKKSRDKTGLMIVEGTRELFAAKNAQVNFKELYVCHDFLKEEAQRFVKSFKKEVKVFETSEHVFKKISFGERLEGVVAVCEKPKRSLQDLKISAKSLLLIVERVEKPGNLGAILRTADAAGIDGVILADSVTDASNPNVVRSSLGTLFSVPVVESSNEKTLNFLKENKIMVAAADPGAKDVYTHLHLNMPLAIVLGSEQKGLSSFWQRNSDFKMKIPMRGQADSLNVSTTAAILIYEALRQRNLEK